MAAMYPDGVVFFMWRLLYCDLLSFVLFGQVILFTRLSNLFSGKNNHTRDPIKGIHMPPLASLPQSKEDQTQSVCLLGAFDLPLPAPQRHVPSNMGILKIFISSKTEAQLIALAKEIVHLNTSTRRHEKKYGSLYTHRSPTATPLLPITTTSPMLLFHPIEYIQQFMSANIHQAIVNIYPLWRGRGQQTDLASFGRFVKGVSLRSDSVMALSRKGYPTVCLALPRRSLLILSQETHSRWKHGIRDNAVTAARVNSTFEGDPLR